LRIKRIDRGTEPSKEGTKSTNMGIWAKKN